MAWADVIPDGLRRERGWIVAGLALGALLALIAVRQPVAAVAGLILLVAVVALVARPTLLLLVMVAALPWENRLGFPSETLSLTKGIGALLVLAYLGHLLAHRRTTVHLPRLLVIVAALGLWIGLSAVTAPDQLVGIAKLLRYALFFTFFFLIIQLVDGRDTITSVLRWFTASVAAAALYALWLFLVVRADSRVAGPVEDPNDFAYLLGCTLPIAAYLISTDRRRRMVWAAAFLVIAAAMLATFSRGALVGMAAILVWGVATRRVPIWTLMAGLAAVAVVVGLALTVWRPVIDVAFAQKQNIADANTASRLSYWRAALQLTVSDPLTGVGPDRYPEVAPDLVRNNPISLARPVTHNSYLEILSENGIPALALFLAYLATAAQLLAVSRRKAVEQDDVDGRRLATALQASLIVAIVSATFLSEQLTSPFWLLGALAVVLERDLSRRSSSLGPEPATRAARAAVRVPTGRRSALPVP